MQIIYIDKQFHKKLSVDGFTWIEIHINLIKISLKTTIKITIIFLKLMFIILKY